MSRNVLAQVSQSALRHNLQQVRTFAPKSKIIAMVKANAYGHGLTKVAKTLSDCDALGVACIDEAVKIRQAGILTDIVLMEGIFKEDELPQVLEHNFTLVVHHWQQIQALKNYPHQGGEKFKIWLKVNTGMNRLGFASHEFDEAYSVLKDLHCVEIIGYMTHFAQADDKQHTLTMRQYERFNEIVGKRVGERCLANSAGIIAWPQTHADWVRPGLMLYGASPFADSVGKDFNLIPAMSLQSEIIAIRDIAEGDKVGYGQTWENHHKTCKVGIVAMGYGDGYPWHARNGTPVLVNGQRVTTVGRVSMDMLAVDLSNVKHVEVGMPVTLWGKDLPIEEVARHALTIPYELFCRFTERVHVEVIS
ncbi:MAG: alanine racemase [Proteobacteria bacterium]|nr:alanine racemase [Pseudomonadota bacterium]